MKNYYLSLCLASAALFTVAGHVDANVEDISGTAQWLEPQNIWVQPTGDIIIVDSSTHTIHLLPNDLTQSTVIGRSLGLDPYGLPLGGYFDTVAAHALFDYPTDVVVDSKGIIYISDANNHSIRKVVDGVVYTHAGNGASGHKDGGKSTAQFHSPAGLAIDANDQIYVADTMNHVIRKVTPEGYVTTVAGQVDADGGYVDGKTTTARFNEPSDIAINEEGHLFISDSGNQLIRVVANGTVTTFAGSALDYDAETGYFEGGYQNGSKETARFNFPKGLHYEDGYLFIADSLNNRVRAITPTGTVLNVAGQSEAGDVIGSVDQAQFDLPSGVFYANNTLYVTDSGNQKIKALPMNLKQVTAVQSDDDLISSTPLQPVGEQPQIWLNGVMMSFTENVTPFREDGKLYVPVHALFTQAGASVRQLTWQKEMTIIKDNKAKRLPIEAPHILLKNGRSYIEAGYLNELNYFHVVEVEAYNALIIQNNR